MEDPKQIIKIEITWIDNEDVVHIFSFGRMTFPSVELAERMLWEQLKSLDYILGNYENNHLSACILIDEDLQVYKPEDPFGTEVPIHVKKTLRFEDLVDLSDTAQ